MTAVTAPYVAPHDDTHDEKDGKRCCTAAAWPHGGGGGGGDGCQSAIHCPSCLLEERQRL